MRKEIKSISRNDNDNVVKRHECVGQVQNSMIDTRKKRERREERCVRETRGQQSKQRDDSWMLRDRSQIPVDMSSHTLCGWRVSLVREKADKENLLVCGVDAQAAKCNEEAQTPPKSIQSFVGRR